MPFRCEYPRPAPSCWPMASCPLPGAGYRTEEEFESIAAKIRPDLACGLSPAQIADARSSEFRAALHHLPLDRAGLRRHVQYTCAAKVGYRPREGRRPAPTPHGPERFLPRRSALPEGEREAACEMDTVIGRAADRQCGPHAHLRCRRAQLCLLCPERSSSAVAAALDVLEAAVKRGRSSACSGDSPTTARSSRLGESLEIVPAGQGGLPESLLPRRAVPAEAG